MEAPQHQPQQQAQPAVAAAASSAAAQAAPAQQQQQRKRSAKTSELFKKLRFLHDAHRVDASRLETIQKLGEGGFAYVDLCWFVDNSGQRIRVAVKRVRPDVLKHATQLKLFTNESEILVKLRHESIVRLIGLGSLDDSTDELLRDTFFLVEELVDGGSLRLIVLHQMINAPEQLYRIRDAARWSLQMARALHYLHNMDPVVVHRDLKPDNVLLTCLDPHVADIKLADFGLSVMIPNKHVAAELKAHDGPARNPNRESRWKKNMGPGSTHSITGAAAMLHMVENASMASVYEAGIPAVNSQLAVSASRNGAAAAAAGATSSAAATAVAAASSATTAATSATATTRAGTSAANTPVTPAAAPGAAPRSQQYLVQGQGQGQQQNGGGGGAGGTSAGLAAHPPAPASRASLYSRAGVPGSRMGISSRLGPHSRAGPNSRPVSGILSMLGLGGGAQQRPLECPSGIMFDLTSMTGSLLYMAPEVFKGQPYNYKADTFSFGVLMYELLHQRLIMATLIAQQIEDRHTFENEIMEFTKCVSAGFRPPIEDWLPDYMQQLIASCWAQNVTDRPSMQHVVEVLERFLASPELTAIDKSREPGCCATC